MRYTNRRLLTLLSYDEYTDGIDRQTYGRQTVTLRFPLLAVSVICHSEMRASRKCQVPSRAYKT